MTNMVFSKDEWMKGLESLSKRIKIYTPVKKGDFYSFNKLEPGATPDLSFQNTRFSPKQILYPQSERLFIYTLDEEKNDVNIMKESEADFSAQAIVGIRPCDAHGFELINPNFNNPEFKDPWWVKRKEATILIGLGCNEPCPTCFCASVGGGPFDETGLDVLLVDIGEKFLANPLTEKGNLFIKDMGGGSLADEANLAAAENQKRESADKIRVQIPTDQLKDKVVNELFDAPFWEDVAFSCINCGTCTFLCPTCWCFDIQDEVLGKEGDRIRNWDSCMFPLFTLHGSGHNPRNMKMQRVRQRFMHKLKYYVDKYDNGVQCSGCGRCVRYCPVNIDIRRVCELMNAY